MPKTHAIESALAAWRDAERRLSGAGDGETQILIREVQHRRAEYQRLAAEQAEDRLVGVSSSTPSYNRENMGRG